jgi:hypothetical protein
LLPDEDLDGVFQGSSHHQIVEYLSDPGTVLETLPNLRVRWSVTEMVVVENDATGSRIQVREFVAGKFDATRFRFGKRGRKKSLKETRRFGKPVTGTNDFFAVLQDDCQLVVVAVIVETHGKILVRQKAVQQQGKLFAFHTRRLVKIDSSDCGPG